MDLSEFLLARIGEDEAAARSLWDWMTLRHGPDFWTAGDGIPFDGEWRYEIDRDATLHASPRRVLAECDAKRRIVHLHGNDHECSTYDHNGERDNCTWVIGDDCSTMRLLALPYADHSDYRSEWKV